MAYDSRGDTYYLHGFDLESSREDGNLIRFFLFDADGWGKGYPRRFVFSIRRDFVLDDDLMPGKKMLKVFSNVTYFIGGETKPNSNFDSHYITLPDYESFEVKGDELYEINQRTLSFLNSYNEKVLDVEETTEDTEEFSF